MLTEASPAPFQPLPEALRLNRTAWALCGLLGVVLLAIYFPTLRWTTQILLSSEDMAHGLFAPLVALYIAIEKRHEILAAPASPSMWGVLILAVAGTVGVIATLGNSATFQRAAFLASLTGCIVLIGGFPALFRLKFPLLLLLFTFPLPQVLYAEITAPLQSWATFFSEKVLTLAGFSVLREGNLLELPHYRLSIVEACSGIRSLITLAFFCLLYAYFWERRTSARLAVVALSIPAALILNVTRITATGILGETNPKFTLGIYHEALGWACLALAFGLVLVLHRGLRYVYRSIASRP